MAGGRKAVVLDKTKIAQVESLASVLTKGQLAEYFGISLVTFNAIEKRQPEVSLAYKKGKAKAIASIGSNLIAQAKKGNMTAAIFYLKTQAGWREAREDTNENMPDRSITINIVKPDGAD